MTDIPFYHQLKSWLVESKHIRKVLHGIGREVVQCAMKTDTLRGVARKVKLSPTYLSRVKNGTADLSPETFLKLARLIGSNGK